MENDKDKDKKRKNRDGTSRGYYSELATNLRYKQEVEEDLPPGAPKRTKFIWQVKTEKDAPILPKLVKPIKPLFLAPAERWITFLEDKQISFPVETFKPKVQLQHQVEIGDLPRNVAIERKRRQYAAQNIADILQDLEVSPKSLIPVDSSVPYMANTMQAMNFLPLELFDNEKFETRTPESWLEHGVVEGVRHPIPGKAFLKIQDPMETSKEQNYDWINVAVTDYLPESQLWSVLTLDGSQRTFNLPRIYIMFSAENPMIFGERIKAAVDLRNQVEDTIRYEFYLDCMLLTGTLDLDEKSVLKIRTLATRSQTKNINQELLQKLETEVNLSYKRTHGEMQFLQSIQNTQTDTISMVPQKMVESAPAPREKVVTGVIDFKKKREYFKWMNIYVIPETYIAMEYVVKECMKVSTMSLFTASFGAKYVSLEEFDSIQSLITSNLIKHLRGPWLDSIVFNIRACLRDVGKGWFDMQEKKYEIYEIAKMTRFMELVKHRMQYTLRLLVLNSINIWINMLETPCQPCMEIDDDYEWGDDLIASRFKPPAAPLFLLILRLESDGPHFSTDPDQFEKTLLKLYDNGIRQTHFIKQVHPYLLPNLRFPEDLCLSSVGLLSEEVSSVRDRFVLAYKKALIPLKAYAKKFFAYLDLFNRDINAYITNYKAANHSASEYKEEITHHYRQKNNLEATLPSNISIGPFMVSVDTLKNFLMNKRQDIINKLLDTFAVRMKDLIEESIDNYKTIQLKLNEKPDSIEAIFDMRDWMETVPMTVKSFEENTKRYVLEYDVLEYFWYALPQEDFENKWEAIGWPYKLVKTIEETDLFLKEEEEKYFKIQVADEFALQEKIEGLTVQVVQLQTLRDFARIHEIAVDMRRVWKNMKEAQETGLLLNSRQKLFGQPVVPFDDLNKLVKEFEPYKSLWVTASDWGRSYEIWMSNPLQFIDGESIERTCTEMQKTMIKLTRTFADIPAVQKVAQNVREEIDQFRPHIPLILSLKNPGMRARHFEKFSEASGIQVDIGPATTYQYFVDLGITQYAELISSISEEATKEYAVETTLQKMKTEWESNDLELTLYKSTGTFIMKVTDEQQQMLDDHIVLTQQLSFSPFKGPFEKMIDDWEEALKVTAAVIEEWMEVQKQWMYLEPIFTSEDITSQLPLESKKYKSMERTWRRIMRSAYDHPNIIEYCGDRKLLESLKDCNHILEVVQKGLTDYLETKRMIFPRLYFLSDDELLEILSQARNPLAVQPHLRKCFENIATLKFESDLKITRMYSAEGEGVDLDPTLYPVGSVENWLLQVEISMQNTVRTIMGAATAEVMKAERTQWVMRWPGQVVIAGSQAFWTAGVEEGIKNGALEKFHKEVMLVNLDGLRNLVKGSLSFLQREILSALIVIEVHSRDVTQNLVDLNISNANDFDWISQLRYYWVVDQMKVRAVNAEFPYGNEYLGNSGRLVITPLTDRCYLTLTGALHLKFGGAPAGPAGTGKTETTKDLAKAMARQCVVFNCSDQLDFMAMGKFFKGLASSGAWACFDEFNRIDIEVLSVVAQQITTIQKAQQARLDRFFFEGSEIVLKESCAVFITMNPGYAGRTELPDNLKALFRPVSMMVPDYSLIAEISLFSFGFGNAKQLANKITTTFKLSSEQLSSQDHYDFGMRAVKTVIAVAGNLKRERPQMDEPQMVLRSLRDVNVPKFLKDDLKLFNGIVSDLFPRMVEEAVDYGALEKSIRASSIEMLLEDVDEYVKKVIQLYETTIVRHGLMLVGPTGSGKTKCYQILKKAMTALKGEPQPSGYPFEAVKTYVMNPKSITMGQLYGEFDLQTHEWTDGILPSLVRVGIIAENKDKRWYIFDGPVDAVWIENMNTVLDDNKKLCLSSGEIIKLRDTMTMMFEVADLAVASPATVSRCGMVYLEPSVLGLEPFINCWLNVLPALAKPFADRLKNLIQIYVLPAIELVRYKTREILTSVDSALLIHFLRLMDFRFLPISGKDNRPPPSEGFRALLGSLMVPFVVSSMIWSIGATCDSSGRNKIDKFVRDKMQTNDHNPKFPSPGIVYDYKLRDGGFGEPSDSGEPEQPYWEHWMEKVEEYKINVEMKYSDIEVPTIDNVRNSYMIGAILLNERNVLCVGPTGTGKTLTVIAKLAKNMHKKFICDFMSFSARTSANQTQDLIDSKLDRRRKGVFGPPVLKRQIFFIDDFNMPALEVYGAQPPIELIRQWMDFGGWYDRKNIGEFRKIIDVNFATSMGPPGGGRNPVTARLLRHFHFIAFLEMEDFSKRNIFGTILKFWLDRTPEQSDYFEAILLSSMNVYSTILKELLPTPAKTHYTFNLRDLSKVFQGLLMFEPEQVEDITEVVRLWYHECMRVFQDRLVNDEDRNWFNDLLRKTIKDNFKLDPEEALGSNTILFGDFLDPQADIKQYKQITDREKLSDVLDYYLTEYNNQSTRPMRLVLFLDAIAHVCRISRIIRQPMGNALLLGMGGSGRQSLTRLATFMAEFYRFQIELSKVYGPTEWRDDIKQLMLKAGLHRVETVFLFSDTQIKSETFLEDLNNILNSGDVPNIYQPDEMDLIYQNMKGILQELGMTATKSNLFSVYQKQVRSNLHTVITMSPIGEIFRARLRQFPALVNNCTIDWFSAWPDSALQSVALQFLDDIPELDCSEEVLKGIVVVCQFMHASVVDASELYRQELSRHNYVTPTSYLELLSSYSNLINVRKNSLLEGTSRLRIGLEKLQNTSEEIKVLQENLKVMKPALEEAAIEANIMIEKIAEDTKVAEETKVLVEKEEFEATKKAMATEEIAEDAKRDLAEAMPALLAAEESLKQLNKNDITEVRAMKRPPGGVVYVIESICIVKNIKPIKVAGTKIGEKILDYWEPGRQMLADPGAFLSSLMNFDKDSITEEMIEKLTKYVNDEGFQPEKIAKISKACTSLCMWVHAMYKFYFVNKSVAPKKAALKQAEEDLAKTMAALAEAKKRMKAVMDGLEILQKQLAEKIAFKEEKEQSIGLCEERMNRAVRLLTGLGDERVRWIGTIENIEASIVNVTGDILLSAGAIAYLTPFTDKYRRGLLSEWIELVGEKKIPHSENYDTVLTLGEPVTIRSWQLSGLPRDYLSTENAVLVSCSKRWPLFIDPQGQANKWVKNMEKNNGLAIAKLSDKNLIRTLESAVRFGKPVLIENIGLELDPALDPVLLRQVFKQGGTMVMKLGETIVPYDNNFRLFMTTKLPNPHYTPEIAVKILLVNFTLVPSGLQDQLLALVVMQERPDLEEQRQQIVVSTAQMKAELKEIEDRILYKLSISEGSPLDDLDFIITLEASKVKSEDIKNKVESAEITQIDIDNTRALYIPVANRAQILFFCLADLSNVDPMYQYSLEWFISIFMNSMAVTEKSSEIAQRVYIINEHFTFSLFTNVCRSLFEKHKLHFAFLMCARILMDINKIDGHEWHHFLAGGSPIGTDRNPCPEWLSSKSWNEILSLRVLPTFESFTNTFAVKKAHYQMMFEAQEPQLQSLPEPFESQLSFFQRLLVLKCLRPDKVTNAIQIFLAHELGQRFVEPQTTDLGEMFAESGPTVPLIFVLSTGTDPAADLYKFAERMKMAKRMFSISLGQGQGPRAEALIKSGCDAGSWIFFQNCHLAPSWMPRLEYLIENIEPENTHRDFRLWLTSTPSPHFPVSILQNSSKMTIEPPSGIKANLLRAYISQVAELSDFLQSEHPKAPPFKMLLFALCLFHAVLLERRKFGPLGFNIPYEFTTGDLKICISQLHMFLMEYDQTPFKVLTYTAGHINYGGRVTDDWDRRCLMNILGDYYDPKVVAPKYRFDRTGVYYQLPPDALYLDYLDYIKSLPINDDPEVFGMHSNADITFAQALTSSCLSTLLMLQPKQIGGAAASQEEVTGNAAKDILEHLPPLFDLGEIARKYPVLYEESLNTVIMQEAIRYNKLLKVISDSLKDLLKALKGLVVMSEALEKMSRSLFSNLVPEMWASKAYPSLKPLAAWVSDLHARIEFLIKWKNEGIPPVFWISGFYFPQAFLTGTLQNFARKYVISIDTINFAFKVLPERPIRRPPDGCCIWGLFLEGSKWNYQTGQLDESNPKELYTEMPVVWLIPEENHKKPDNTYVCPVYKTLTRAGTLSTTGHSTNYVLAIEVPTNKPERHWIKRGVALICALDY
ncbi:dynein axonemal heavy chain 1-like [Coccinella septempunctata]|uniref:dynein axonemal heavy chain 1-like n=1 Tax=Coccinella septempunctata TaxID=41139 RepID=UPI001D0792AA|nr:dynein axonemal heavy chain 1-like [Coccinella septempunctata]